MEKKCYVGMPVDPFGGLYIYPRQNHVAGIIGAVADSMGMIGCWFRGRACVMRRIDSLYISDYLGKNRLLLLFSPSVRGPACEAQMQFFEGEGEEFDRRDLLLGTIYVEGTSRIGGRTLDHAEVVGLREDFGVNPDETLLVLVDKDGTELMRDECVVLPERIYGYIDQPPSEPVRRQERKET